MSQNYLDLQRIVTSLCKQLHFDSSYDSIISIVHTWYTTGSAAKFFRVFDSKRSSLSTILFINLRQYIINYHKRSLAVKRGGGGFAGGPGVQFVVYDDEHTSAEDATTLYIDYRTWARQALESSPSPQARRIYALILQQHAPEKIAKRTGLTVRMILNYRARLADSYRQYSSQL